MRQLQVDVCDGRKNAGLEHDAAPDLLFARSETECRLAAVLVMRLERASPPRSDRELGTRIANHLLDHGDVEGIVLQEVRTRVR